MASRLNKRKHTRARVQTEFTDADHLYFKALEAMPPRKIFEYLIATRDSNQIARVFLYMDMKLAVEVLRHSDVTPKRGSRLLSRDLLNYIVALPGGLESLIDIIDTIFDPDLKLDVDNLTLARNIILPLDSNIRREILSKIKKRHAAEVVLDLDIRERNRVLTRIPKYTQDTRLILQSLDELTEEIKEKRNTFDVKTFIKDLDRLSPAELGQSLLEIRNPTQIALYFASINPTFAAKVLQESKLSLNLIASHIIEISLDGISFIASVISAMPVDVARYTILQLLQERSLVTSVLQSIILQMDRGCTLQVLVDLSEGQISELLRKPDPNTLELLEELEQSIISKLYKLEFPYAADFLVKNWSTKKATSFFVQLDPLVASKLLLYRTLLPRFMKYLTNSSLPFIVRVIDAMLIDAKENNDSAAVRRAQENLTPLNAFVRGHIFTNLQQRNLILLFKDLTDQQRSKMLQWIPETEVQAIYAVLDTSSSRYDNEDLQMKVREVENLTTVSYKQAAEMLMTMKDKYRAATIFVRMDDELASNLLRHYASF